MAVRTDGSGISTRISGNLPVQAQLSPDGRWIAYVSAETGRPEVYVSRFPGFDEKSIVSSGGGAQPRWRRNGKELFYLSADGELMTVRTGRTFSAEPARPLFRVPRMLAAGDFDYDVAPDGQRFLFNMARGDPSITVVVNWPAVARRSAQ
jgi:hypothetical protein